MPIGAFCAFLSSFRLVRYFALFLGHATREADLNRLVKLRLDTMKRIPVEQAEIARYTKEYYRVPSIRQQLIEDAIQERLTVKIWTMLGNIAKN